MKENTINIISDTMFYILSEMIVAKESFFIGINSKAEWDKPLKIKNNEKILVLEFNQNNIYNIKYDINNNKIFMSVIIEDVQYSKELHREELRYIADENKMVIIVNNYETKTSESKDILGKLLKECDNPLELQKSLEAFNI